MTSTKLVEHATDIARDSEALRAFVANMSADPRPLTASEVGRARRVLFDLKRHVESALVELYPLPPTDLE